MAKDFVNIGNMIFKSETISKVEFSSNVIVVYNSGSHTNVKFKSDEDAEAAFNLAIHDLTKN